MLIKNIGQLVTLKNLRQKEWPHSISRDDLSIVSDAWLKVINGKITEFGSGKAPEDENPIDAKGGLVLPGLVDCHTHPLFGGNRSNEFAMRLDGKSYQEIAAAGGGILSTVNATRTASEQELVEIGLITARRFLKHGVTTFEAKSGYGLSVNDELKMLTAIRKLKLITKQTIKSTLLALHAVPKDKSKKEYIRSVIDDLLPKAKNQNLADYVDAFVEKGYFEPEDCEEYMQLAKKLGFAIRIHADEFADSGAAKAAAAWGAKSADHLEMASEAGITALAEQKVVAVLLPGTSLYCKIPYTNAKKFTAKNCAVALATDFNPGSCRVDNLAFIATIGALHCNMSVAEALAAVTYVPAYSLDLHDNKGHLDIDADADILIYENFSSIEDWIADLGQSDPDYVFIAGEECSI